MITNAGRSAATFSRSRRSARLWSLMCVSEAWTKLNSRTRNGPAQGQVLSLGRNRRRQQPPDFAGGTPAVGHAYEHDLGRLASEQPVGPIGSSADDLVLIGDRHPRKTRLARVAAAVAVGVVEDRTRHLATVSTVRFDRRARDAEREQPGQGQRPELARSHAGILPDFA